MNGAGRRRGDFADSPNVRTHAPSRAELKSSRARGPNTARGEFAPATVMRNIAQTNYSKRFRAAYGPHRSTDEALHRTSSTKSLAPFTERRGDAELQLGVASVPQRRRGDFGSPSTRLGLSECLERACANREQHAPENDKPIQPLREKLARSAPSGACT